MQRHDLPTVAWPPTLAQSVLHAIPHILLVLDGVGRITHANASAVQALGVEEVALIGVPFLDLLDEGSRAKAQRVLTTPSTDAEPIEINHITSDGHVVSLQYRAQPLSIAEPESTNDGLLLIGQPLAETVAITERLVVLNRRLSALFRIAATTARSLVLRDVLQEALDVTIGELDLQAGAIILQPAGTSSDSRHETAVPIDQIVAQHGLSDHFAARLTTLRQLPPPWQRQIVAGRQSLISGTGVELGIASEDFQFTLGPLLSVAFTPIVSDGQDVGWLVLLTDRYRTLNRDTLDLLGTIGNLLSASIANARLYSELSTTSGRLQAVLDTIDSGVLLVGKNGVVRYANTRLGTLLGVDVTTWPGCDRQAVMPPTLVPYTASLPLVNVELWELPGTPHRILRRYSDQVRAADGTLLGAIEVYSDVTDLQEMARLKDEFVAAAAHDLKTPVTAVKGYAQIALKLARRLDDQRLAQQLAMINARSNELAYLMDGLLDMSRIQAGRLQLDIETFDLRSLITKVVAYFEFDLQRRNRTLTVDMPYPALDVAWDQTRIEGVLINLIGNAIKYSPDGGPISIGVRADCDQQRDLIHLTVTDHGIGIPPEERALIFDRFYRVQSTAEHGFKGTGIGLYVSEHTVHLHGGRIWADDAIHGGPGTTMHVELPRRVELQRSAKDPF